MAIQALKQGIGMLKVGNGCIVSLCQLDHRAKDSVNLKRFILQHILKHRRLGTLDIGVESFQHNLSRGVTQVKSVG